MRAGPVRVMMPGARRARGRPTTVRVQVKDGTAVVVREVPLEEYVAATALSEVHPPPATTRSPRGCSRCRR